MPMASRPAKRQRRSTIILSDDGNDTEDLPLRQPSKPNSQLQVGRRDDTHHASSPQGTKKPWASANKATIRQSPNSSPQKTRKSTRTKKEADNTKSLHTFFGKATEEQRWYRKSKSASPTKEIADAEADDLIEDDDLLGDVDLDRGEGQSISRSVLDRRKQPSGESNGPAAAPSSSIQRFVKPTAPVQRVSMNHNADIPSPPEESHRTWADRYGPSNLEELAVHKKKVADVRLWLENVLSGRDRQKLLVLKGPAGSGKTTAMSLLSQELGFDLAQWQNPTVLDGGNIASVAAQFEEYLNRGGQFGSLMFDDSSTELKVFGKRVLLVEDFPNVMTRFSSALDSFRLVIMQFLARSGPTTASMFGSKPHGAVDLPPLVILISETLLSSSTAFSDSFTAHRLLGSEILSHSLVTTIEFNPVAPTFITKALDLVAKKEARDSKRRRIPGPAVFQRLAEMGDVRSAVNSLEFLCVRNDEAADWSGTVATKAKKTTKENVRLTEMEKSSLQLISQRETTLDMFHAAGKVVYNKREDSRVQDTRAAPPPKPPDHLMYLYTPQASLVDIEALLNETGTDIQTFISTLHENYVLSCNGDSFVDALEGCAEILSISDVLNPDSRRSRRSKANNNSASTQAQFQSGSSDALRQDEISFQTATRGLLFNLPYPVNRAVPSSGRKMDAFKMFYPASLRLWKPIEETESMISLFVHSGSDNAATVRPAKKEDGVASWAARISGGGGFTATQARHDSNDATLLQEEEEQDTTPVKVTPSHDDLVLEILPYMTKIQSARKKPAPDLKILQRITQLNGIGLNNITGGEGEPDDLDGYADGDGDDPDVSISRRRSRNVASAAASSMARTIQVEPSSSSGSNNKQAVPEMEKLYLSDDDIEDD